jgi:PhoPQ-activated pathogenicity-related protein
MTSQHWLTTEHVTRTEWYHELVISVPYNMDRRVSEWGVMLIDGGSNRIDNILKNDSSPVVGTRVMAMETGTITACLRQVPNQPLYFENDPRMGESGRKEDDIIAWTWKHFLENPDESDWVLRLPMTKAARLALDTIDDVFQKNKESMNLADVQKPVDNFLITGASKRGWTTWTLAAVDKRVKAQVPMVLDCLNMEEIFLEWFRQGSKSVERWSGI